MSPGAETCDSTGFDIWVLTARSREILAIPLKEDYQKCQVNYFFDYVYFELRFSPIQLSSVIPKVCLFSRGAFFEGVVACSQAILVIPKSVILRFQKRVLNGESTPFSDFSLNRFFAYLVHALRRF